jgi:hypothetical protein
MDYCDCCGDELTYATDCQDYDSSLGLLCDQCQARAERFELGKYGPQPPMITHLGWRLPDGRIVSDGGV